MKKKNRVGFTLVGFIGFFVVIGGVTTASIFIYTALAAHNESVISIAACMLGMVVFGTLACVVIDIWRRRIMVQRPTEQILDATERIAAGDFDVFLTPKHRLDKYDEYDRIMENINVMAKELRQNEVLKTDFVANVSHEIKTPLAIIQNYATMLSSERLDENTRKEYTKTLVGASKRLSDLITNILKLNKLENGDISLETENFDLSELVRGCVLSFEEVIDAKNLSLECDIDEVSIVGYPSYLEIALNNLLSNAIKFTDEGTISVMVKKDGDKTVITVSDTGCGMSETIKKHLFDKFYQGDTSHTTEGNGLGLALVKRIVEIMGGEIIVISEPEQGSSFVLSIKTEAHG